MKTLYKIMISFMVCMSMCSQSCIYTFAEEDIIELSEIDTILSRIEQIDTEAGENTKINLKLTTFEGLDQFVLVVDKGEDSIKLQDYTIQDNVLTFEVPSEEGDYEVTTLECVYEDREVQLDLTFLDNREFTIEPEQETVEEEVIEETVVEESKNGPTITLDQTSVELIVGTGVTLHASQTCTWSSSDTSVATVVDGVVYGVSKGQATIYANYSGAIATCTVNVVSIPVPTVKSVKNKTGKVEIIWSSVGADSYAVYKKTNGSYQLIGTTSSLLYQDSDVSNGTSYTYVVKSVFNSKKSKASSSMSITYTDAPTIKSVDNYKAGVTLKWSAITGATKYGVYRKVEGGSWKGLTTSLTSCTYTDTSAVSGTKYYYAIKAYNTSWSYYGEEDYLTRFSTPSLTSITNTQSGVKVKWSSVDGAELYRIYRKVSGGSYSILKTVDTTSFTDTSVEPSKKYIYTVKAGNGTDWSNYISAGISLIHLQTPAISKVSNGSTGLKVSWSKVEGATGYYLYRWSGSKWEKVVDTTSLSATDTAANIGGATYRYTVKAYSGTTTSSYDTTGVSQVRLLTPAMSSCTNKESGILVKWKAVDGADSYKVYRKADGAKSFQAIGCSSTTSYTDESVQSGTKYVYTIKALKDSTESVYDSKGIQCIRVDQPNISNITNASTGIKVEWNAVEGATSYKLYRYNGSKYECAVETTSLSATDKTANTSGTTYRYTVRALIDTTLSSYHSAGSSLVRLCNPKLVSVQTSTSGLTVKWDAVEGATSYNVYRKDGSNWYSLIKESTTSTSYTDTTAAEGVVYTYTVRALNGTNCSSYSSTGIKGICLAAPSVSLVSTTRGVKLSWNSVNEADGYNIYRKKSGGSYTNIGTTTSTTYTDTTGEVNVEYTYAIKAYKDKCESGYSNGVNATIVLGSVTMVSATKSGTSIIVKWKTAQNAQKYRIYRKENSGSWTKLTDVTSTSYTDSKVRFNIKYSYTVKAVNGDYVSSTYDTAGVSAKFETSEFQTTYNQLFYVDGLLIANKKHSLPTDYAPGENAEAGNKIRTLINDMRSSGYNISTSYSGYRSYAYQQSLYNSYVASNGQAVADTFSARPGYSEHQTGLAFDLMTTSGALVQTTNEVNWIAANAYKYGFIVRYTEDKQAITGYMAEPWHLRYVGSSTLAKKIKDSGLCLEEYLGVSGGSY